MDSIYWAAFFSFIAGAFGYFITRFWVIPIGRYRVNKRRLEKALVQYRSELPAQDNTRLKTGWGKALCETIRRHSMALADLYNGEIPYWYRLVLLSRQEDPLKACDPAMRLDKSADAGQARRTIDALRTLLRLKTRPE